MHHIFDFGMFIHYKNVMICRVFTFYNAYVKMILLGLTVESPMKIHYTWSVGPQNNVLEK